MGNGCREGRGSLGRSLQGKLEQIPMSTMLSIGQTWCGSAGQTGADPDVAARVFVGFSSLGVVEWFPPVLSSSPSLLWRRSLVPSLVDVR